MSATEMALVHNIFIRVLNCIYLQALNVESEKDTSDFIIFTWSWVLTLHEHHRNEENIFFPMLEDYIGTKGAMEKNVEQHHAFEPGLNALETYVVAVKDGKEKYDGAKIIALIDSFGPVLAKHLTEEIVSFEELEKLGDKIDWKAWNKKVGEVAVGTADKVCVHRRFGGEELTITFCCSTMKSLLLPPILTLPSRKGIMRRRGRLTRGSRPLYSGGCMFRGIKGRGGFLAVMPMVFLKICRLCKIAWLYMLEFGVLSLETENRFKMYLRRATINTSLLKMDHQRFMFHSLHSEV